MSYFLQTNGMVNVLKFQTLYYISFLLKSWLSGLKFTKCLSEWQTGKTLIRLLLSKQSDLNPASLGILAGN